MARLRTFALALAFVALACASTLGVAWADVHARDQAPRIVARVLCARPAEDTLAHVRLVALTHEGNVWRVDYRCARTGY